MKTTVNAHFRQMPTQEAQHFCCTRNVLPILSLRRKRSRDAETCTWAEWLRTDESSKTLGALTKRTRSTTVGHQNITTFLSTGGCIRNVFVAGFGCIRSVFGCIPALPLRYEQTTHLNLFIYIPNVSKALAIKGQTDGGEQKMENLAELTLFKF